MNTTKQKSNRTLQAFSLTVLATLCLSTVAVANDRHGNARYQAQDHSYTHNSSYPRQSRGYQNRAEFDYARVVDVRPIVEEYQVSVPVEHCFDERVPRKGYANYPAKQSRTPEIFGALIGAAVGHQFGGGRGKDLATVAGAVLGGSIGRDVKNNSSQSQQGYGGYEIVSRCEVSQTYQQQQRIVGYNVSYSYNGSIYQTRTEQDPGDRIRVSVMVQPG